MAEDIHQRRTAKQAQDPVCKMIIDVEKAAAKIECKDSRICGMKSGRMIFIGLLHLR